MEPIKVLAQSEFKPSGEGKVVYVLPTGEKRQEEPLKVEDTGLPLPFKSLNPIQTVFYKFYKGGNALVAAPTSAGKTGVAVIFFQNRTGRLVYTAPTKALVTEKAKELKKIFGEDVDIRTGDVIEEFKPVKSRIVVSTYENLTLALRNAAAWVEDIEAVVIDEVHSLMGSRGAVVEELITALKGKSVDLLALSATIPGANSLADWLNANLYIKSDWRPVPLERKIIPLKQFREWIEPKTLEGSITGDERFALKMLTALFELTQRGEKVIVFVPKKSIGWKMLEFANRERLEITNKTAPFEVQKEGFEIAFHNADVPAAEREEIEKAFARGELNILIATQTLAYGVNLPADKVLIGVRGYFDPLKKRYTIIPDPLDILQEEGRAGRFGIKEKGYSYILPYGGSVERISQEVKNALEGEFEPYLSSELKNQHNRNDEKVGVLALFLLAAIHHRGGNFKEFLKESFSLRLLADHPAVDVTVEWLLLHGYISLRGNQYRLTEKGEFCLRSGLPPFNFEEYLRRRDLPLPTEAVIRPLLYTKRFDALKFFLKEWSRFEEDLGSVREKIFVCGAECLNDNTDLFLFYTEGKTFYYPNLSNPPGDFSYLGSDALHLMRTLLGLKRLGLFNGTVEDILKIAHTVKYGLNPDFAPLGGIKGIGHVRANLLKQHLLTESVKGVTFGEKVENLFDLLEEGKASLKEDFTTLLIELRGFSEPKARKEAATVVSLLDRNRNTLLVDDRILYTLGLFLYGQKALGMKRGDLLKKLLEEQ